MAAGAWAPIFIADEPAASGSTEITVPADLTDIEQKIIGAWFRRSEAVAVDPWWPSLGNGRHRLWRTLPHLSDSAVPVCGVVLRNANARDVELMSEQWWTSYADYLAQLEAIRWLDRSDPVHQRFESSLRIAAEGRFPIPV